MNQIVNLNASSTLTMSSREIAELTGKEHKNVLRDIRAMLNGLNSEPVKFESCYVDAKGEKRECFNLPKRETLILVSGYSVELRARIIDRWMELEEQATATAPALPDFSNPAIAARAWAEQYEQRVRAETTIKVLEGPATVGIAMSNQRRSLMRVVSLFPGVNTMQVARLLMDRGYIRKVDGVYVVYAKYKKDHFTVCMKSVNGKRKAQVCVGPKGYEVLAHLYSTGQMVMLKGDEDMWKRFNRHAFEAGLKGMSFDA